MITGQQLAALLVRHGIVQAAAILHPEGYDNYATENLINAAARDLGEEAESQAEWVKREKLNRAMKLLKSIIDNCSASEEHIREYQKLVDGQAPSTTYQCATCGEPIPKACAKCGHLWRK